MITVAHFKGFFFDLVDATSHHMDLLFQRQYKLSNMTPNGFLIFEDENFMDSTVAKMNALRKSGQFCDVRLQVGVYSRENKVKIVKLV